MTDRSTPPSDAPGIAAWEALLRAHAAVVPRVARDVEEATGLPLAWYDVLLELSRAPQQRLRMQQLGGRVVVSRTRVSRIVDDLTAHGLAARQRDPDDGRATLATITSEGRQALRRAAPTYLRAIDTHFAAHLDPKRLDVIRQGLQQIVDASDSTEEAARTDMGATAPTSWRDERRDR
jgi:DNA-binding MarR family transcriptional regulator